MSNIHTLGGSSDRDPVPNPWGSRGRTSGNSGRSGGGRSNESRNWGGGQSLDGHTSSNPWAGRSSNSDSERGRARNNSDRSHGSNIHTSGDYSSEYTTAFGDQGEMPRISLADPVWSDNLPPDQNPGFGDICCYTCGCGCFVGPCCSPVRRSDWCNIFKMFTFWTAIVQLVMFIVSMSLKRDTATSWMYASVESLLDLGAKYSPYIVHKYHLHRLILPVFLHAGILHYVFNMLFTFRVMFYREPIWGRITTGLVYLLSAIAGNLMSAVLYTKDIGVGASGALLGIFGYFIMDIVANWNKFNSFEKVNYIIYITMFMIFMLIFGFVIDGVDNAGHLGGLLSGLALGLVFHFSRACVRVIGIISFGVVVLVPLLLLFLLPSRIPIAQ